MRATAVFFLYILVAYLLAALLLVPIGGWLVSSTDIAPNKFIGRGGLLLAMGFLVFFLRWQGLANKSDFGYGLAGPAFRRSMTLGWIAGILILACLTLAQLALNLRFIPDEESQRALINVLAQGILGGLAVGFIEETFFRGALFSAVRRQGGSAATAVIVPSLLFAMLHFIKPQPIPPGTEITLMTSLDSLASAFPNMFRAEHIDSFAALFMVGVFLALVRHRTGNIAWCIGLHAGWVLVIKLTLAYTYLDPDSPYVYLVGTYDDLIGWLAAGWLGVLSLGLIYLKPKAEAEPKSASQ